MPDPQCLTTKRNTLKHCYDRHKEDKQQPATVMPLNNYESHIHISQGVEK